MRVRDRHLRAIAEKPEQRHLVNAGIYVLSPSVCKRVERGRALDMTELFSALLTDEEGAVAFPIREYWMDVGRLDDLERARCEFDDVFAAVTKAGPTPSDQAL